MSPLISNDRFLAEDLQRIARPHVMQAERHMAAFEEQFVAAASCIDRRFAVMNDDGSWRVARRLHPKRQAETIGAGEVADARKRESVFAAKLRGLARFARNEFRALLQPGPAIGSGEVLHLI